MKKCKHEKVKRGKMRLKDGRYTYFIECSDCEKVLVAEKGYARCEEKYQKLIFNIK